MNKLIPKYQTAWGKMPTYLLVLDKMKTENPVEYDRLIANRAKAEHPHSEVVLDENGKSRINTGAGYLSAADPVGEFVVGNAVLNPVFKAAGTAALYGMGRTGSNWARAKLISRAMTPSKAVVPVVKPETSLYSNVKLLKRLLQTDDTVPAYFGPKYEISDVVNPDGTINVKTALKILQLVAKSHGVPNMQSRLENPKWHKTDPNTFLHTKEVTQRAYKMPVPEGYTKLELVFAALGHDFGKMWAGEGHGPVGAGILKQMFPNMSDDVYLAIYGHMRPLDLIKTTLGKYTKYADIGQTPPKFKSELDWSPKSWFKDAAKRDSWTPEDEKILASHVPEYLEIEKAAKANGTWLKMKDGSTWLGDPRSWVQMQSKDYTTNIGPSKLKTLLGDDVIYVHTSPAKFDYFDESKIGTANDEGFHGRGFYLSPIKRKLDGSIFTHNNNIETLPYAGEFGMGAGRKGNNNYLLVVRSDNPGYSIPVQEGGDITKLGFDSNSSGKPLLDFKENFSEHGHELVAPYANKIKSLMGNNGDFNLKDKNIYRILAPFLFGTSYLNKKGEH